MKNFKKIDIDEIDDMLLDSLIKHCEDSMSAPYKEKAKAAIVMKTDEDQPEEMVEQPAEPSDEDELDDDKKEKLRAFYAMMKD